MPDALFFGTRDSLRESALTSPSNSEIIKLVPSSVIEILILNLKPRTVQQFSKFMWPRCFLLLKQWNFKVVSYGPSLHGENSFYVIRSFSSLEERQKSGDTYYSSDDGRRGLELQSSPWSKAIRLSSFLRQRERHGHKHDSVGPSGGAPPPL
jgi:hypothetical protein